MVFLNTNVRKWPPLAESIICAPRWSTAVVSPDNDVSIHLNHTLNWAFTKTPCFLYSFKL